MRASCPLTFLVHRIVERFKEARWRNAILAGRVPAGFGFVAASALIVAQSADHGWPARVITIAIAAFVYWTRVTPLLPLGLAAALGLTGLTCWALRARDSCHKSVGDGN